ncbi:hypothetical protein K443DRAFT_117533, partial [Laccaria amethystina LaAM-08-1]
VYRSFKPDTTIEYVKGCCTHIFVCAATYCHGTSHYVQIPQQQRCQVHQQSQGAHFEMLG